MAEPKLTLTGDPMRYAPGTKRAIGTGGAYAKNPGDFRFSVDAHGLADLGRDFRRAAERLAVESRKTLTILGTKVWADAAQIAAANGSQSIPDSMHGLMVGPYEYHIRAGGPNAPMAGLWELGNRREPNRGANGRFQHPLYGNKGVQITQPRYPFFRPALKRNRYIITKEIWQMWDRVLTPYRMTPV